MPGGGRTVGACGGGGADIVCAKAGAGGGGAGIAGRGGGGGDANGDGGAAGTPAAGRGVDALMSCWGGAWALVGDSSSLLAPIASSIRVSPTTRVLPGRRFALFTLWPL